MPLGIDATARSRLLAAECRLSRHRRRRVIALDDWPPRPLGFGEANRRLRSSAAIELPAVSTHCIAPIRVAAVAWTDSRLRRSEAAVQPDSPNDDAGEAKRRAPCGGSRSNSCPIPSGVRGGRFRARYWASFHARIGTGVEPATARFAVWCSTSELTTLGWPSQPSLESIHGTRFADRRSEATAPLAGLQ